MQYTCKKCGTVNAIPSRAKKNSSMAGDVAMVGLMCGAWLGAHIGGPLGAVIGGPVGALVCALIGKDIKLRNR